MAGEFGTGKTVFILAIVAGCFAVLWPKLFYPMLQASMHARSPAAADDSQACCDVIFENDVNAIKIMTEMCGNIMHRYDDFDPKQTQVLESGKLSQEVISTCRREVLDTCGIDITAFLNEKVRLGKTYKQMLDEIRSFNSSVCLKRHFGLDPGLIGAPHRMRISALIEPRHHRQERPPHLRPDLLHPALQERGRAIPQSHIVPKVIEKEGKPPGPIPGMRPPMGGAGHVVPAPKGGGGGTMGIVMPIYTIGIVVFFMYTIMKVMFKKSSDPSGEYEDFSPDPEFRKMVFAEEYYESNKPQYFKEKAQPRSKREASPPLHKPIEENGTKLGDVEIDHLRRRLEETEAAMERIVAQMGSVPHKLPSPNGTLSIGGKVEDEEPVLISVKEPVLTSVKESVLTFVKEPVLTSVKETLPAAQADAAPMVDGSAEDDKAGGAKVKIVGMEMTASCEGGQKWSRPGTPVLSSSGSRTATPVPPLTPEPQSIFLEGALPSQSQLMVTDSETQALPGDATDEGSDSDPPVILSGKMTLSLISLDAALAAEDEQHRRTPDSLDEKQRPKESASVAEDQSAVPNSTLSEKKIDDDNEADDEEEDAEEEEEEEEEEIEEEEDEEEEEVPAMNNAHTHSDKTPPTSLNYTTASAAAEATNATGPEETAADVSAIDSSLPDDQEEEDELEDEEEVWNGDVDSGEEEESEEEEEEEEIQAIPPNAQHQH